jgi:hypothetical protein
LASSIEQGDPGSPKIGEAFGKQDTIVGLPANGVKSFPEVQFENGSRSRSPVTSLDDISGIDKVFSNRATRDETRLVLVNQGRDKVLKVKG